MYRQLFNVRIMRYSKILLTYLESEADALFGRRLITSLDVTVAQDEDKHPMQHLKKSAAAIELLKGFKLRLKRLICPAR